MVLINKDAMALFFRLSISFIFVMIISHDVFSKEAIGKDIAAKEVIGWIENVRVSPGDTLITAKIDTGADTSSLHCDCINKFDRNGEPWVEFKITGVNGKQISLEKKVERTIKIKRHFGAVQERVVVRLGLCLGGQYEERDVSLVDRSGFKYDLLIGRKFMAGKFIVDPSQKFLVEPHCENTENISVE